MKRMHTVPRPLTGELDEALAALAAFDVERLEALERRIRSVKMAQIVDEPGRLAEMLEKHAMLGRMLAMTAANLKVLVPTLHLGAHVETRYRWLL
ncbi:hypothetical protein [Granulicella arctica]|uniref:Uncharacterized protein n=1 Tax=Granulicella arctica TaxID=940613 RepID=A0A7Y9PI32_9BACT|nr:hypothetical protein [Granulicella arctica]NYF80159.1 hypothetical protein [Granulicella arctica]